MEIVVCIKQVPASSDVSIDQTTGTLIRDGNNTKMNPYDLYGIEMALRIKEATGAKIKTLSMGPSPAKSVLMESLWMGCDSAMLLSDRAFGGADVVATSYAISQGIKSLGKYDLIICGKQTTDGDTAQVGPEIAEHLNIPHVSYVDEILEVYDDHIIVKTEDDNNSLVLDVKLPCLITVNNSSLTPRLPSYKRSIMDHGEIPVKTLNDLEDKDNTHYGLKGSPTQVEKMFPPTKNNEKIVYRDSVKESSNKIFNILKDKQFI